MRHSTIVVFVLAAGLVAGCGGGSSSQNDRIDELEMKLSAAEAAAEAAAAAAKAKAGAAAAAEAAAKAEAEAAAKAQAEAEAAESAAAAEAAAAEVARQAEAARRSEAEQAEQAARQRLNRLRALEVVQEIPDDIAKGGIAVPSSLRYRESVLVTVPGATFTNTSTGSLRGWFMTSRSGRGQNRIDTAEVYSNVEASARENFRDHSLGSGLTYDASGITYGHILITDKDHGSIAASNRFPRSGTQRQGERETFPVSDRGPTKEQNDAAKQAKMMADAAGEVYDTNNPDYRLPVRVVAHYPERYSVDVPGTLMGASGNFRCESSMTDATCTVDRSGPNNYVFTGANGGEWQFIPSSATAKVIIPDAQYMWFGWWSRAPIETETDAAFDFAANYGGTNAPAGQHCWCNRNGYLYRTSGRAICRVR